MSTTAGRRRRSRVAAAVTGLVLAAGLAACGDSEGSEPGDSTQEPAQPFSTVGPDEAAAALAEGAVLIDVRTPEEYAAGHLEGARNVPLAAADFEQQVAELDPALSYVVYCRTGSRAQEAIAAMTAAGVTETVNAGGFDDLVAGGLAPAA